MSGIELAQLYIFSLGGLGIFIIFYQVVAVITRREIKKAMRGYLMVRTIQPRDSKGRFRST